MYLLTAYGMICIMNTNIPPISAIKSKLGAMSHADIQALADASKVPFTTLLKIRSGITVNPGIETVRKFYAHFKQPRKQRTTAQGVA